VSCKLEHSTERRLIHCITSDCYRRRDPTTHKSAATLLSNETHGPNVRGLAYVMKLALDSKITAPSRKSRNVQTLHKPCYEAANSKTQVRPVTILHLGSVFRRKYSSGTGFSLARSNHIKNKLSQIRLQISSNLGGLTSRLFQHTLSETNRKNCITLCNRHRTLLRGLM